MRRLLSSYSPRVTEAQWASRRWDGRGRGWRGPFSLVLPPPNVTGQLHVGHALTAAVQDAVVRRKRQEGFEAVWIPGLDHAGIATQVVVEKQLRAEGTTRLELGREEFVRRAFRWKEERGGEILKQFRRLGVAFDWDRLVFTLDPAYSEAVTELFCRLYDSGLVYRGSRAVNWCPALQSVVSDIEVELKEVQGVLHHVDYGNGIQVATTRPETIYADVAVAVHSQDERFKGIEWCTNPLTGTRLPVIRDDILVDPTMGTGAVKVTPAHSFEDHECGRRHELPMDVTAFDELGRMHSVAGEAIAGMDRLRAREHVVNELKSRGCHVRGEVQPRMRVPTCSRSGDVLEPSWKPQWFVDTKVMSQRALSYTDELIPEKFRGDWKHFLVEQRDWCISRQLWWGHRIPAYQVDGKWIVSRTPPEKYEAQDPDVLDTWFSSALFPLASLGWPRQLDCSRYPLNVMETGSDILFFWVARMAMVCSEMEPAAGAPFKRVALHPMVRDRLGRKMSKSVGNVIDPVNVIEGRSLDDLVAAVERNASNLSAAEVRKSVKAIRNEFPHGIPECGADALRFTLIDNESNDSVNLDVGNVEATTRLCNKIWNAAKFVQSRPRPASAPNGPLRAPERWLLARLATLSNQMLAAFDTDYVLHRCTKELKSFLLAFCDHYIEYAKLSAEPLVSDYYLHHAFESFLVQLHPFMPFLTEHLLASEDVIDTHVPIEHVHVNVAEDVEPFAHLLATVSAIRQLKTVRKEAFQVWIEHPYAEMSEYELLIRQLARHEAVTLGSAPSEPAAECLVIPVRGQMSMAVFPKQEASGDEDAFVARKLERLEGKLQRLDEKWAKMDLTKVREVAKSNYEKTRSELKTQIESLKKNR